MNAPLLPELLLRPESSAQIEIQLAAAGVLRYVWHGRFGPMLIEVSEGRVYVNGSVVEPVESGAGNR